MFSNLSFVFESNHIVQQTIKLCRFENAFPQHEQRLKTGYLSSKHPVIKQNSNITPLDPSIITDKVSLLYIPHPGSQYHY